MTWQKSKYLDFWNSFMSWFKSFSKRKVDKEILDLYETIEILIMDIDEKFTKYFNYVFKNVKYTPNKKFFSVKKVHLF